jgi:hypothetical protein
MITKVEGCIDPDVKADDSCEDTYHDLRDFIKGTFTFVHEDYDFKTNEHITAALR